MRRAVFRFAPSSNGYLHLGHAYSACLNYRMAQKLGGEFLLRIEDIDLTRCHPQYEQAIYEDLQWLGLVWQQPVRHQSQHFDDYRNALDRLQQQGLIYPSFLSRAEVKNIIIEARKSGQDWPRDPEGNYLHPVRERDLNPQIAQARIESGEPHALRLNMDKAMQTFGNDLFWVETGRGPQGQQGKIRAAPHLWGDIILARKDTPTSYHLSVVIDDALQQVTHIVRGQDLFFSTSLHRLLQRIFEFDAPIYHHHDLIMADKSRKLSKSAHDISLRALRKAGLDVNHIYKLIQL